MSAANMLKKSLFLKGDMSLGKYASNALMFGSEFGYPQGGGYDQISKYLAEYMMNNNSNIILGSTINKIAIKNDQVVGVVTSGGKYYQTDLCIISLPAYDAINNLFDSNTFDSKYLDIVNKLNKTTSMIEIHFGLSGKIDNKHIVFPVDNKFTVKGIFFISNIAPSVSPSNEHLIMAGTPIPSYSATNYEYIRSVIDKIKNDIQNIYPTFERFLIWERPQVWKLVESVVKGPGMVWKQKMNHHIPEIKGLFFVGDSTVSYGIGTDSAAHSALLCYPKIVSYLKSKKNNTHR